MEGLGVRTDSWGSCVVRRMWEGGVVGGRSRVRTLSFGVWCTGRARLKPSRETF